MALLTVREVAEELRISQMTVRRHIASGKLRAVRVGRGVRIDRSAVDRFVTPVNSGTDEAESAGRPLSFDDPIRGLVGIIDDDGPTDASVNHDMQADGDLHSDEDIAEPGVLTFDDSLWNIVGIGASAEPTDIRRFKDEYIADAIAAPSREP